MRHTIRSLGMAALGLTLIAMIGCAKQKSSEAPPVAETPAPVEFHVTGMELGKQIDDGKKVVAPTSTFGPKDTIYVSVATEGASSGANVSAKWTYGDAGQLVKDESQSIAPTGPAATEFHISKPSGWPKGKYKVEVTVNGSPAGSKEFEVKT
jgi:hypothetical protein